MRAYNLLGYDAAAIGNHEFDFGPVGPSATARAPKDDPRGALRARAAEARFPFLDGNLVDKATGAPPAWDNVRPTTIVEVAAVKVGIIGITTIATGFSTLAAELRRASAVRQPAPAVTEAAAELRRRGRDGGHRRGPRRGRLPRAGGARGSPLLRGDERDLPAGAGAAGGGGRRDRGRAHPRGRRPPRGRDPDRRVVLERAGVRAHRPRRRSSARPDRRGARFFRPYTLWRPESPEPESYEGAPLAARRRGEAGAIAPALAAARARRGTRSWATSPRRSPARTRASRRSGTCSPI